MPTATCGKSQLSVSATAARQGHSPSPADNRKLSHCTSVTNDTEPEEARQPPGLARELGTCRHSANRLPGKPHASVPRIPSHRHGSPRAPGSRTGDSPETRTAFVYTKQTARSSTHTHMLPSASGQRRVRLARPPRGGRAEWPAPAGQRRKRRTGTQAFRKQLRRDPQQV